MKIHTSNILKALITAAVLSSIVLVSGCGAKPATDAATQAQTTATQAQTTATQAQTAYPLTVKDAMGTEMTLKQEPIKIVSLTLGTDEMLVGNAEVPGLVDLSRVFSVTQYADDPAISNISGNIAQIANRLDTTAESIIASQPDLVFTDTWSDPAFVQQLRSAGIMVYVFQTPSSVAQQREVVLEIAHVVGEDKEGQRIVEWMDGVLGGVAQKLAVLKPENKLKVMEYSEMFTTSGIGTNFDSVVTSAGLVNVVSEAGMEGWPQISKEKIVELNPDIILLPSWYYDKNFSLEGMKKSLVEDKSLSGITAIAEDRLISVPNQHISAISHFVVLGVLDVAKAAYPDLFK